MCTTHLKFLDINSYLSSGFRYHRYLKAYGCQMKKGVFPYEWMDNLQKLKERALPPPEAFYSLLNGCSLLNGPTSM